MHLSPSFGLIYRLGGYFAPHKRRSRGAGTSWLLSVLVRPTWPARAKITIVLASYSQRESSLSRSCDGITIRFLIRDTVFRVVRLILSLIFYGILTFPEGKPLASRKNITISQRHLESPLCSAFLAAHVTQGRSTRRP